MSEKTQKPQSEAVKAAPAGRTPVCDAPITGATACTAQREGAGDLPGARTAACGEGRLHQTCELAPEAQGAAGLVPPSRGLPGSPAPGGTRRRRRGERGRPPRGLPTGLRGCEFGGSRRETSPRPSPTARFGFLFMTGSEAASRHEAWGGTLGSGPSVGCRCRKLCPAQSCARRAMR